MFHLNHVEGVVGPPSLLVKLNIARQSFKTDLKDININEESKLVSVSRGGDSAAVRGEGKKDGECGHVSQIHAGERGHLSDTGLSLGFTLYSMPGQVHSHSLNLPLLLKPFLLKLSGLLLSSAIRKS